MNYQHLGNGSYNYVKVGHWIRNELTLSTDKIQLPGNVKNFQSVCSDPCKPGFKVRGASEGYSFCPRRAHHSFRVKFQKILPENGQQNKTCCWHCIECKSKEISDGETCKACGSGQRPNHARTGICKP